ncbi:MAG: hypothetical protein KF878_16560 [Planctomycetes bacterium]|nr:hypothetical protein [Planctomycetota bacterium]
MSMVPGLDVGPGSVDEAVEWLALVSTVPGLDVGPRGSTTRAVEWLAPGSTGSTLAVGPGLVDEGGRVADAREHGAGAGRRPGSDDEGGRVAGRP